MNPNAPPHARYLGWSGMLRLALVQTAIGAIVVLVLYHAVVGRSRAAF